MQIGQKSRQTGPQQLRLFCCCCGLFIDGVTVCLVLKLVISITNRRRCRHLYLLFWGAGRAPKKRHLTMHIGNFNLVSNPIVSTLPYLCAAPCMMDALNMYALPLASTFNFRENYFLPLTVESTQLDRLIFQPIFPCLPSI